LSRSPRVVGEDDGPCSDDMTRPVCLRFWGERKRDKSRMNGGWLGDKRNFAHHHPRALRSLSTCLLLTYATPRRTRHDEPIHHHDHQARQSHKQRSPQPQHASVFVCLELDRCLFG
jgi:hypothetical protein